LYLNIIYRKSRKNLIWLYALNLPLQLLSLLFKYFMMVYIILFVIAWYTTVRFFVRFQKDENKLQRKTVNEKFFTVVSIL